MVLFICLFKSGACYVLSSYLATQRYIVTTLSCSAEGRDPFWGFISLWYSKLSCHQFLMNSYLPPWHRTEAVTVCLYEAGSDKSSGFPFWGLGVVLILTKLSVTPVTDKLPKLSNTYYHLWQRAKWAAMNTEQGFVNFLLPALGIFQCFDTMKRCLTE